MLSKILGLLPMGKNEGQLPWIYIGLSEINIGLSIYREPTVTVKKNMAKPIYYKASMYLSSSKNLFIGLCNIIG